MAVLRILLLLAFSCSAMAQPFPSRPVTLIVPFSPGTGIDILARVIAPKLAEKWGQPVVVENKAGASGNIGTELVAKAPPDGHTLMVTVNTFTITPSLIKQNPGKYFFASPGNGTPHHIGMELIKLRLGLNATHVPYKGFAGAMQDLIGGQVHMMFTLVHSSIPHAKSGRIKILGVTGTQRSPQLPEAPTFREQGIDFMDDVDAWYAVLGPAKIAPELAARLNADVNGVMALPEVKQNLLGQGLIPVTSTPEALAALIKSDLSRWAKVIDEAKITVD